jgi:hypothetical protein
VRADSAEGSSTGGIVVDKEAPKKKPRRKSKPVASSAWERSNDVNGDPVVPPPSAPQPPSVEDLYGSGKAYPEPYTAGKLSNQLVHDRYRRRFNRETFLYSVRFRAGPLGLSFDNKVSA